MRIVKKIVLGLIVLIAVLAAIGLIALPRQSQVERSLVIHAPAEIIFDQVNDLKKNEAWSPWKDPNMTISYGSKTEGVGATSSWTSKKMGNGSMTIEESVPSSSIKVGLDFGGMGTAKAQWSFMPEGDGIKVTETMFSDAGLNPAKRWMSLMTDKMVGPYFEKGLAALKQISETRAAALKAEQQAAQQAAVPADQADNETTATPATPTTAP